MKRPNPERSCAGAWTIGACWMLGVIPFHSAAQLTYGVAPEHEGPGLAIEQAHLRESNPLRLRPELQSSPDSAWVSSAEGTYRHRWGRQQLQGFGRFSSLHYSNQSNLNHDTYRVGALADLETVGDWGARLNGLRQRDALEGQLRLDPLTGQRRLQTLEQVGGALLWGIRRRWTLQSEWQHEQLQPNRPQVWWPGYEQNTWRLQVRSDVGQTWFWTLGWRQQEGTQRSLESALTRVPAVDYRTGVWDFEWNWRRRPGDSLIIRASNGRGQRKPQEMARSDAVSPAPDPTNESAIKSLFAEIRWQPSSPVSLLAMASRDQGQQTKATQSGINGEGLLLQGANDVRQARIGLQWDVRPGWQLAINRQRMDRMGEQSWTWEVGQSAAQSLPLVAWQDRLDRRSVGITWQLNRRAVAQCAVRLEERSGTGADDARTPPESKALLWKDRMALCSLRWQVRSPA